MITYCGGNNMGSALDKLTGRKRAKKAQKAQEAQIAKQRQAEELKLAEEESEVARRKATARGGRGGRSLLVATSPTGTARATNLGGTA